jgi:hypothetical protein
MKLACQASGESRLPGVPAGNLPLALLVLADHLANEEDFETVVTGHAGRLEREIISNQIFNAHGSEVNMMDRFLRRWVELPEELPAHPRVVNLLDAFEDATGVSLLDFAALGMALWSSAQQGRPRVSPDHFASLNWDRLRLERALDLLVADIAQLRVGVLDEVERDGITWAVATFERFPVVRMWDQSLLVLDPHLLARRFMGLLPLFDVTDALQRRGDTRLKKKVEGCYEHVSEAYGMELLRSAVPDVGAVRLYDEDALRRAYGTARKVVDAAIDYGDGWVIVEITSSRPKRGTVSGQSEESVSDDLDKLVRKAGQLASTIDALRSNESALTGAAPVVSVRFHPVLVVADGFPVNPISLTMLRERLSAAGVLQQHDVAPLEVLDLEELELVDQIHRTGGPSLRQLLREKERSKTMHNTALRDFILLELRLDPGRSPRRRDRMRQLA